VPVTVANVPRPQAGPSLRPPAVAGAFYPRDDRELALLVDELLGHSQPPKRPWKAAMVPHAGLKYSGRIAAAVLQRIEMPDTILVLGPKHTRQGVEWAVAPHETWSLPGRSLPADPNLARELCAAIPDLELDALAHADEHSIEVELPFIARLAPRARVVGIVLGGGGYERCCQFATGLAGVLRARGERTLLIISSDMNHFASDEATRRLDEMALAAIAHLNPQELHDTVRAHHISMCGVLPAVIVMETLRQLGQLKKCHRIGYATSGDVTGDRARVVGYAGLLFE
jgi:AmmeMemoRadiSam system protein B